MASTYPGSKSQIFLSSSHTAPRLARAMSSHASAATVVFAGAQVAGCVALSDRAGGGALPFVALALLTMLAIPFARRMERRWARLSDTALPSQGLMARFRRDRGALWRMALLVPALWLGLFAALSSSVG